MLGIKGGLQVAYIPFLVVLIVAVALGAAAPAYFFLAVAWAACNAIILWPEKGQRLPSLYEHFLKRIGEPND